MCRPIESRDSLGAMGPAAAALFAGYQPSGNKNNLHLPKTAASAKVLATMRGAAAPSPMPWAIEAAMGAGQATASFGDNLNMLSMAGPPPSLPFVSFPKNLPSMPWMGPGADVLTPGFALAEEPALLEEVKPMPEPTAIELPRRNAAEDFEAAELEELLDFSIPDDLETAEKDKEDLINLDDGFDGTEMSILYSFLVDAPEEKAAEKKALNVETLEEDFTDEELKMTPPPSCEMKTKGAPEVKSRRLCKAEGCYKRSRSNGLCISHGGGRRCAVDGCDKSSQGGNLCIRHGGGKRCSFEGCDKAAQSNFLCKAHGGGPRCQVDGCTRSSQGGGFCRSHGGGKRCMFDGCTKGTQRGDYCALHGGSRLCEVPGCMRNDRGGGLCATHGGGKRCSIDGCGKPCRRKGLCSAHLRQSENSK